MGLRSVSEAWVRQVSDERGYLGSHTVLANQGCMGVAFQHETLEKRSVQIIAFPFLDCQAIMIDFRAKLSDEKVC